MLQLKKFSDIPVSTREEARESRPHPEEPRFRLLVREEGSFPLRGRERISRFPVASQEEVLFTGKARGTPGSCHNSQITQMSQSILGKTVFPALPRLSSRGSTHTPVARETALWVSLVGKPRGKATDPLIHAKGSVTCCYSLGGKRTCRRPLGTRTHSPGETPEVPQDPCQHWRGILRFRHRLHTRS